MNPMELISKDRLDVMIKYRYFCDLMVGRDNSGAYERHILKRTVGVEPVNIHSKKPKRGIEAYIKGCKDLLESMKKGFDSKHPIPVSDRGILNGSHRLACALGLGIDVKVKGFEGDAKRWVDVPDLKIALREYALLTKSSIFVIWEGDEEILDLIPQKVGWVKLNIMQNLSELVQDIYLSDSKTIRNKADKLSGKMTVVVSDCSHNEATEIKKQIRKGKANKFEILHAASNEIEAAHLARTLLSENNLRVLNKRVSLSKELSIAIKPLFNKNICVVGGAVMATVCDYKNSDVDIIGSVKGFDTVAPNYHRVKGGHTDSQILECPDLHYYVRGVKFANPEIVIARKKKQAREKDLLAVKLYKERHDRRN